MNQLAFYYDQTRCVGCNACVVACKDWNGVNPGPVSYRKCVTTESGSGKDIKVTHAVYSCNHCDTPKCVESCTAGAIMKNPNNGVVIIDKTRCAGLGLCVAACPYNSPKRADDKQEPTKPEGASTAHPAQKCTFCRERLEQGKKPICVAACPVRALDCGTVEYIKSTYPLATRGDAEGFPQTAAAVATGPNIWFKKKYK